MGKGKSKSDKTSKKNRTVRKMELHQKVRDILTFNDDSMIAFLDCDKDESTVSQYGNDDNYIDGDNYVDDYNCTDDDISECDVDYGRDITKRGATSTPNAGVCKCRQMEIEVRQLKSKIENLTTLVSKLLSSTTNTNEEGSQEQEEGKDKAASERLLLNDNTAVKHLVIGDSLLKNMKTTSDNVVLAWKRGAMANDVTKWLKQDPRCFKSITVVCGTNNLNSKHDNESISEEFEVMLKVAKDKSSNVVLSSILPCLQATVSDQRLCNMNERLSVITQLLGVKFIDNDKNFRHLKEIPDVTLLQSNGLNLSEEGVLRLLNNLNLGDLLTCEMEQVKDQNHRITYAAAVTPQNVTNVGHQSKTLDRATNEKPRRRKLHTKSRNGVTLFYGSDSIFSNLHMEAPIYIDGAFYNCNEQYYTYSMAKFFNENEIAQESLRLKDPYEMVALHKKINKVNHEAWMSEAKNVLYLANMAKYSQNAIARTALISTGDDILGEASRNNTWGIGGTIQDPRSMDTRYWTGHNVMGTILMKIRKIFQQEQSRDCEAPYDYSHGSLNDYCRPNHDYYDAQTHNRDSFLHTRRSCWFCGEQNHISTNCRHGQKIQCRQCFRLGHKEKFCKHV